MQLVWMIPLAGIAAVLYALWLARDVLSRDAGTPAMQEIGGMIFEGAMAFLRRQYRTIAVFAVLTAIAIGVLVGVTSDGVKEIVNVSGQIEYGDIAETSRTEGLITGVAFLLGAF